MIDEADRAAIKILAIRIDLCALDDRTARFELYQAIKTMNHAIRHLAYPDRDVYPKTRRGTKGDPVRAARALGDYLR